MYVVVWLSTPIYVKNYELRALRSVDPHMRARLAQTNSNRVLEIFALNCIPTEFTRLF